MPETSVGNLTIEIDSVPSLTDAVRVCAQNDRPIVDYGVAHAGLGFEPPQEHAKLAWRETQSPTGVIEHYERDMTVRASAFGTVAQLDKALAKTNQFLPIDADGDLTLGEVIQHNVYGPMRVRYGAVRDLLLGLHFIDGDGRDIHVGGRTVKNVAGYDVTRFLVGALGEFGIVHEATLRTYARPEQVTMVDLRADDPTVIDKLMTDWLLTEAAPTALSISNEPQRWTVHVAYFGRSSACAVQLRSLETLVDQTEGLRLIGSNHVSLEGFMSDTAARRQWRRRASSLVRIMLPPGVTGAACAELHAWAEANAGITIEALPSHGCIFAGGELSPHGARRLGDLAMFLCRTHQGQFVWHARPPVAPEAPKIAPFGPPQSDWTVLQRIKKAMDPRNIFNPGRFTRPMRDEEPTADDVAIAALGAPTRPKRKMRRR